VGKLKEVDHTEMILAGYTTCRERGVGGKAEGS